jgi:hypothetical protein
MSNECGAVCGMRPEGETEVLCLPQVPRDLVSHRPAAVGLDIVRKIILILI